MKAINFLIILTVIAVIAGGFYLFQKNGQKEALIAHNRQKFQQMTKTAEKSSSAGLLAMASAINKFHQDKGHYPKNLLNLYPDFIPERPFISKLNWKYTPGKGGYLLQKSVEGGHTIASMGPNLRLKTETDASSTQTERVASTNKSTIQKKSSTGSVVMDNPKNEPDTKKDTADKKLAKISLQDLIKTPEDINSKKEMKSSKSNIAMRIIKKALNKDEKFLLSFSGNGLYIWKSKNGVIGFSNIQYPDEKILTIYQNKGWIEYNPN